MNLLDDIYFIDRKSQRLHAGVVARVHRHSVTVDDGKRYHTVHKRDIRNQRDYIAQLALEVAS